MLALTAAALLGAPLLILVALMADTARGRLRFPILRVYLFVVQYLINDSVEIILAPLLWLAASGGKALGSPRSMARHQRLQAWSIRLLFKRADQLLGLSIQISQQDIEKLGPGPVIVISRHASLLDASLPGHLYYQVGFQVKGVIMAELLADPGFDLIYGRTGSVFIPRDDGQTAQAQIASMSDGADATTALVIFPEGRLFSAKTRDRRLERLAASDPHRWRVLGELKNVLPPRPGGVLALLDHVPEADVVLIEHRGLDRFKTLADLAKNAPNNEPIVVSITRINREDVPADTEGQTEWLDRLWVDMDGRLYSGISTRTAAALHEGQHGEDQEETDC